LQRAQQSLEQRDSADLDERVRTISENDAFVAHRNFLTDRREIGKLAVLVDQVSSC
jgi:hypothetical protein